jgi:hypothetical protein
LDNRRRFNLNDSVCASDDRPLPLLGHPTALHLYLGNLGFVPEQLLLLLVPCNLLEIEPRKGQLRLSFQLPDFLLIDLNLLNQLHLLLVKHLLLE